MAVLGLIAVPFWGLVFYLHDYTSRKMVSKIVNNEKHLLFGIISNSAGWGTFFMVVASIILWEMRQQGDVGKIDGEISWGWGWLIFGLVFGAGNYIWHYNRLSKKPTDELRLKFMVDGDPEKDKDT